MLNKQIYIKIYAGNTIYDHLSFTTTNINHLQSPNNEKTQEKQTKTLSLRLHGVTVHLLVKSLSQSEQCRSIIHNYLSSSNGLTRIRIYLIDLSSNSPDTIDYNWNEKCYYLSRERSELDHTLSWLSTLGGAFSALGDYFTNCAETAAKISAHQFQLALRLGDPGIASRCRLYYALSLIQRKKFKQSKAIITYEYRLASSETIVDHRLIKMCKGIWSKLKYEWSLHKHNQQKYVK